MIVQQHPADGGEADDDGYRNRPGRDPDVAGGLPFGLVRGDLAVTRLVLFGFAHRPPPPRSSALPGQRSSSNLPYTPAVVDGRKLVSNAADGSAAPPLLPVPAIRPKASAASAAQRAAPAAVIKTS